MRRALNLRLVFFAFSALALGIFGYMQWALADLFHGQKLSIGEQCTEADLMATEKENPNKMLFISCGGFLE
jgi:hypothetical protein